MTATNAGPARFAAFRHVNFRIFWVGNLLSIIGTLAHQTAQGWLVRDLTPDPRVITLVAACNTLPVIFLSLHAGALADRVDKRKALIFCNITAALATLILALLVWLQLIQVWHVIIFALVSGSLIAFEIPTRQSFQIEMVGREDLPNAITLASASFHTARVVGPVIGGFLIHTVGLSGCFFLNSLSFFALIIGLLIMQLPAHIPKSTKAKANSVWKGVLFVRRHETLQLVIVMVGVVSVCAISFGSLLPVFAKDVFGTDARGFAMMLTCNGVGALCASSSLAFAKGVSHRGKWVLLGAFLFCVSLFGFAASPNLIVACIFLVFAGFFVTAFGITANTLVQTLSPNSLRGRIFSLFSLFLIGGLSIGSLLQGFIANWQDARVSAASGAIAAAIFSLWVFWKFRRLWKQK